MDWTHLGLIFLAGVILGAVYFSALWLTLARMGSSPHPYRLLAASLVLRLGIMLAAFYFIMGEGHWERLAAALLGFLAARAVALRRSRRELNAARMSTGRSP